MNIIRASGGLANQIYQYIFLRSLEINTHIPFIMDNLFLLSNSKPNHNGFELDRVFPNIKLKCVTDYFNEKTIIEIIKNKQQFEENISIVDLLNENGIKINVIFYDGQLGNLNEHLELNKSFKGEHINIGTLGKPSNKIPIKPFGCYYLGVWYTPYYFQQVRSEIMHELQFPTICDRKNSKYLTDINQCMSVGVHVRRGDFVDLKYHRTAEQYAPAINHMREQITSQGKSPTFFIISDDMPWCRENIFNMGVNSSDEVVFVEGNMNNGMNYIDMQLLSNCKFLIRNYGSTFSQVASLFNQNLIGEIQI